MNDLIAGLQNQGLRIPLVHYENVQRLAMTGQSERHKNRDNIPFKRYVDIWWVALCIGIQEGRRTKVATDKWHQFIRAGEVLPSNPERVFQLQLMAVGETGNTDILRKPSEIISMANEYAATGLPFLINEALGSQVPIWAVTSFVEKRIKSTQHCH